MSFVLVFFYLVKLENRKASVVCVLRSFCLAVIFSCNTCSTSRCSLISQGVATADGAIKLKKNKHNN